MKNMLVTGCAGFIGSNYCRYVFNHYPDITIYGLDALTYAGNLTTMMDLSETGRFNFYQGNIQDPIVVNDIIRAEAIDTVVNFAAESHNDRSLQDAAAFIQTDVAGVFTLLEAVRQNNVERMLHVSTDEVYGSATDASFTELTPLAPNTRYSASKAGGDMQARAHHIAYHTPVVITRCGNNFGPYQYPEKLIPFFITRLFDNKKVPLYGDGSQVRDWVYVEDHCSGIHHALLHGAVGEVYNVGSQGECTNMDITERLLALLDKPKSMIKFIEDPRGGSHDRRYSIDSSKLQAIGWKPEFEFNLALADTVKWYVDHQDWWRPITDREDYRQFISAYYGRYLGEDL